MHYGQKAKEATQREWEHEYDSDKQVPKLQLTEEEINNVSSTITDEEIYHAANGLGEKGVAWDHMAHWVPKLLTRLTPEELV